MNRSAGFEETNSEQYLNVFDCMAEFQDSFGPQRVESECHCEGLVEPDGGRGVYDDVDLLLQQLAVGGTES